MQQSPDRHSSSGPEQPPEWSVLPFSLGTKQKLSTVDPIGWIDLDQVHLPESTRRLRRSQGKYHLRKIEANLTRLVDELECRFDQFDAELSAAISLAEAD